MTTSLTQSMVVMDAIFRNPAFYQDYEDHIPFILKQVKYKEVGLDPAIALKFTSDFNGLMMELQFAPKLYYPSLRLNGLKNSADFKGSETMIRVIDTQYFELFVNTWRQHHRTK